MFEGLDLNEAFQQIWALQQKLQDEIASLRSEIGQREHYLKTDLRFEFQDFCNEKLQMLCSELSALFQRHFEDGNAEVSEEELLEILRRV